MILNKNVDNIHFSKSIQQPLLQSYLPQIFQFWAHEIEFKYASFHIGVALYHQFIFKILRKTKTT